MASQHGDGGVFTDKIIVVGHRENLHGYLPSAVTLVRVMTVPLFIYTIIMGSKETSLVIFLFLCLTDLLDGYLARRLNASSSTGAYLDVFADFLLVAAAFLVFVVVGTYPLWTLLIITAMFLQFLVTSRLKRPTYDPVGKYYGGALFLMILLTLLFQESTAHGVLLALFVLFTAMCVVSRCLFLVGRRRSGG